MKTATAFAPASVGNVAVGFDVLGLAIEDPGDRCTATRIDGDEVVIRAIRGLPGALPVVARKNTAGMAAISLLEAAGADFGVELILEKGIPLGSGMGGSAASAVAGVMAVNALLDNPLPIEQLLIHAMAGEALASGGKPHADNIAPSLYGGLTMVHGGPRPVVTTVPVPGGIVCVLIHPHLQIETSAGRSILSPNVPLAAVVEQLAALSGFLAGCFNDDPDLIGKNLRDIIVEPQRACMVPGFRDVQYNALDCGALGCSLSGSGPSVFAWARTTDAQRVAAAMQTAFAAHGLDSDKWISTLSAPGAHVEKR